MKGLPCDVWARIHEIVGFSGKYLFLAPVSKQWSKNYKKIKNNTNFENMMETASTVRESGEHEGRETLSKNNAWSYIAREFVNAEVADELVKLVEWDEFSVGTAGRHGNEGFFRWLRTSRRGQALKWDSGLALSCSALEGNLPFLKHMYYKNGYVPDYRTSGGAALVGSVKVLRWLKQIHIDLEDVTQVLAEEGHLTSLIWANSNGIQNDQHTMEAAKYGGNIDVINYIKAGNGNELDDTDDPGSISSTES